MGETKLNKLKVFSMFSGIGGFEVGLINSDYDFEVVGFSEIDKYAISIYEHHFPEHKNFGDATLIDTADLPDFDLLVGGFPCFTGDTLVLTDKGSMPIKEIKQGDMVLTHTDNYQRVVNVMVKPCHSNGLKLTVTNENETVTVTCTSDHPFYTKNKDDKFVFVEAQKLTLNHNLYGYNNKIYKIRKIEEIRLDEEVYNLEVDTDNSYTANGLKCHNCQAFSVAGKRKGFDDTRGTLFFEIARILRDKRPRYFLLENVRGLLSHDKGKTFQTILEVLSSLGYYVKWEVFNSKNHSVPQNRERVFIKGYFRGECSGEVLLEKGDGRQSLEKEITDNRKISNTYYNNRQGRVHYPDELMNTLTTGGHNGGSSQVIIEGNPKLNKVGNVFHSGGQAGNVYNIEGLSPTLAANGGGAGGRTGLYLVPTTKDENFFSVTTSNRQSPLSKRQDNYVIELDNRRINLLGSTNNHQSGDVYGCDGLSRTLCCSDWKAPMKIINEEEKDYRIRRLTPRECEKLQAFPVDWTKYGKDDELISDTQRYKCCGNAVTTTVIKDIINEMFEGVIN